MTGDDYAREVHENAVAHGWWEGGEGNFPEIAALIQSEVCEAHEEYREGKPLIYGCCGFNGTYCEPSETCDKRETEGSCKPGGLAVELCDAVISMFDYRASWGVDIEAILVAKHEYNKSREYRHGGKRA